GCVVENRKLVWLDPDSAAILWKFTADADLVGEPQSAGNCLVIADISGKFLGLDPKTGEPLSKGYTLKANVAPAAVPVLFGTDRLFAPLTDGTVLWLSLDPLRSFWDWFRP